ncbi:hypothetical protein P170DRAFT_481350 [Aspergillus steynii IBT 23096]|uniref:Uncharacterized protein n=1 Tax=Aspergillus steynii IBT 23096 TaxID=1392250 RepID=A0A2I2FS04_9EURO|nr:uncharacterized protein P170DRAFT_481350 [Aspergillus steynii IBT 23096]PLB43403.1 hypothetical protein P170DRAFT_481350 [Aspergillus steynii IBT 23096]
MLRIPAILFAVLSLAVAARSQDVCIDVCQPVEPVCPSGQRASGMPGCWGCCHTIPLD